MLEPPLTEFEGFEPQTRARSNTWPLPRPENYVHIDIKENNGKFTQLDDGALLGAERKNSSRRNPWGSSSYADLITQAIASVPEKRLTLSQIYEWMVQNVPYFKDKRDSSSSAGWKNSIRHNLSLHSRFMRVQNEETGKSSWWMINPDAKPGKSSRRRAASMETSKFEKRRGRIRKKVEMLRNGLLPHEAISSPGGSVSQGLDKSDSPNTYRPRASSNASSCGRLSPVPFSGSEWTGPASYPSSYVSEQLAGDLAEGVKLHQDGFPQGGYTNRGGPYQSPENINSTMGDAASPYGPSQCPIHRVQGCSCSCAFPQCAGESLSLGKLSPSPDFLPGERSRRTSWTMMGQLMGALNSTTILEDLDLNLETFRGGFDCNVDEVMKHELLMDGSLDLNFLDNLTSLAGGQGGSEPPGSYHTTVGVTGPSWVL